MGHRHLTEDDLERMCLGTIDLDELARLTEHVLSCAECAERLEQSRDYIHAMQRALKALPPDQLDSKETN
jgi:anti-sigma factor RsiW